MGGSAKANCPCCGGAMTHRSDDPVRHHRCSACGHMWRDEGPDLAYYREQEGRNPPFMPGLERKLRERFQALKPLLDRAERVLEVGCAEGGLGRLVKTESTSPIDYVGVDISRDAGCACPLLDAVHRCQLEELPPSPPFDLALSFHLLEHLKIPLEFLDHLVSRLSPDGRVVIEVPHGPGNRRASWDHNPEHIHFFCSASLTTLCEHAGLVVEHLETGAFESPLYNDSLRLIARRARSAAAREAGLRERLRERLGPECIVWGVGRDFSNWVRPYLSACEVVRFVDSDPGRHHQRLDGVEILAPETVPHLPPLPILVASLRFQAAIIDRLTRELAIPEERIITLEDLFDADVAP